MTRVLVTGAQGFVGTHLVPSLRRGCFEVDAVGREAGDVTQAATWSSLAPADVVIHLAGRSFVPDSWSNTADFVNANVMGTMRALEYCRSHRARLVFLSSYLYGNSPALPISESAPLVATNPYAMSKLLAEDACRFYAASVGGTITVLRPFNVYGPGQPDHFLIGSIVQQALSSKVIRVRDLEPRRDYVYVQDLVEAITCAVAHPVPFGVFNVGSGVSHSVGEIIRIVQELQHTDLPVESAEEPRRSEIPDTVADIGEAERGLGWTPRWSLRDGLRETIHAVAHA